MKKIIIITAVLFLNQTAFSYDSPLNLSEISFKNNKSDWIEIKINSPLNSEFKIKDDKVIAKINPDQISDEKYILIHFKAEKDKIVSKNNIIHIYTKNSGITGTTEQITIESESKILDAVCWKNNSPTVSELNDIKKLNEKDAWVGECINSDLIEKNQSIVKKKDTREKSGWEIFKHPTPGNENKLINLPPVAVITIQKGNLEKEVPFSLNLDGSDSHDPENDDLTYKWIFPDKTVIKKKNPPSLKFENSGTFEITLKITDSFGLSDTEKIQIKAFPKNNEEFTKKINLLLEKTKNKTYIKHISTKWPYYTFLPIITGMIVLLYIFKADPY